LIVNHSLNQEIEEFVVSKSCSYLDAIVHIAEKKGIEMESVAKMLNKIIKQKLEAEASRHNLLKNKIATLPL
jgi:hypothetical protein